MLQWHADSLFDAEDSEEDADAGKENDAPDIDACPLLDWVSLRRYEYGKGNEAESE